MTPDPDPPQEHHAMTTAAQDTPLALRGWASGCYPLEAGVELLLRGFSGRFARPAWPWIVVEDDGSTWVDATAIPGGTGALSGGEQRFMAVVASLLDTDAPCSLTEVLPGLDRDVLGLVLAAVAHAGGSHEHSAFVRAHDGDAYRLQVLESLYPWPAR